MRTLICLFTFFLFTISCTKDGNTAKLSTYRLEGLSNISLSSANNNSSSFVLTFNQEGNIHENVSLSFTGLPAGVTIDDNYAKTGKPNFSSYITFRNNGTAISGTYPIVLHCTGSVSGERTFSFTLSVSQTSTTNSDCGRDLAGLWTNCDITWNDKKGNTYTANTTYIVTYDENTQKIMLANYTWGDFIYGYMNCDNDSLTIPIQKNRSSQTCYGLGAANKYYVLFTETLMYYDTVTYDVIMQR